MTRPPAMRVIRPVMFHAVEWPEAVKLLSKHASGAGICDTSADDGAYWRHLAREWDGNPNADLLVIEGDIGIHADVLPQLQACPEHWCEFRHANRSDPSTLTWKGLGCDRFSWQMRRAVPAGSIVARLQLDGAPPHAWAARGEIRWDHIDGYLYRALEAAGFQCHEHWPAVRHLSAEDAYARMNAVQE